MSGRAARAGLSPFEACASLRRLRVTVMDRSCCSSIVIASVVKQSRIFPRRDSGCFVARAPRNDGARGKAIALQFALRTADTRSPSRGAFSPESCLIASPLSRQGRSEGRAPAGTRSPCAKRCTRGGPQVSRTPGLPCAMVYGVLRALPGERCTIAPVAMQMIDARARSGRHITARLDAQTPGVRTTRLDRPRTSSHVASRVGACSRPKPCEDAVSAGSYAQSPVAHGFPPCNELRARRRRVHRCPARGS